MYQPVTAAPPIPPKAGLVYYPDSRPGISRRRCGSGFAFFAPDGTTIADKMERRRLLALAVPPAYEKVWICPRPNGHLQATGFDARARKQYRYHPDWTAFRARLKFDDLVRFGEGLPRLRGRVARVLSGEGGDRDFAIAAIVALLDRTAIRIGHPAAALENGTHGATTLARRHVSFGEDGVRLRYRAKGGKLVRHVLRDRRLHKVLQALHDLPGRDLVRWVDEDGTPRAVASEAVNEWIADTVGEAGATAKTFRTWAGTLAAFEVALGSERPTIRAMAEAASARLANTPTIARKSYIHPDVIALADAPLDTEAFAGIEARRGLRRNEELLLGLLSRASGQTLSRG
jgi:DNA topoisomerase-1